VNGFESRILRKTFRLKGKDVTGESTGFRKEEVRNFLFSPNIMRIRRTGHVSHIGGREMHIKF
jgi:hypothetical protein